MSSENQQQERIGERILKNVHFYVRGPGCNVSTVKGDYLYYHYGIDNYDDSGWGCGYRTLQSLCSWVKNQHTLTAQGDKQPVEVPSIPAIQEALVAMGDKEKGVVGSKSWIGSFEVCLCLDYFYDVSCKILHVQSGRDLASHISDLQQHFQIFGSPIMMGGDKDSASKGILGVCTEPAALLVMDPHYYKSHGETCVESLIQEGFLKWKTLEEFDMDSFYNLCLPQLKTQDIS